MPSGPSSRSGRTKTTTDEPGHIERGSGNVFADLGIPNPDLALAKAELVRRIRDVIAERKLTQAKAAELLGLDQPKVSTLVRGPRCRLHHRPPLPAPNRPRSAGRNHRPAEREEPLGACGGTKQIRNESSRDQRAVKTNFAACQGEGSIGYELRPVSHLH